MAFGRGGKPPRPECDLKYKTDLQRKIDRLIDKAAEDEEAKDVPIRTAQGTRDKLAHAIQAYVERCGPLEVKGRKYTDSDRATESLVVDRRKEIRSGTQETEDI